MVSSTRTIAISDEQATSSGNSRANRTTHSSPVEFGVPRDDLGNRWIESNSQESRFDFATKSRAIRYSRLGPDGSALIAGSPIRVEGSPPLHSTRSNKKGNSDYAPRTCTSTGTLAPRPAGRERGSSTARNR